MNTYHQNLVKKMGLLSKILLIYLYSHGLKRNILFFNAVSFQKFCYELGMTKIGFPKIENSLKECKNLLKGFA